MGAWIEIRVDRNRKTSSMSHPTWVRGLKYKKAFATSIHLTVAPYMGAWIEIH